MNCDLNSVTLTALLAVGPSIGIAILPPSASAADTADQRDRLVESRLKDLSTTNDAAIARQRIEPGRELDALGNPRVVLRPEEPMQADKAVRTEVQSSLHRLRRETVSQQTEDGRKARVDESLERASRR
jgi:hypothetical protein